MKLTIRNKLIAGFSCLFILMSAVAGIGIFSLFSLKRDAHDATTIGDRLNSIAIEIQVHNLEAQRRVNSYLAGVGKSGPTTGGQTSLDEAQFEINEMETLAGKAVAISPGPEQRAKFVKLAGSLADYKAALAQTIQATQSSSNDASQTRPMDAAARYELAADTLHDDAEDGEVVGRDASQASEEKIERTSKRATSLSIGIALLGLILGAGTSAALIRAILRPVDHLREVAENVSLGNLDIAVRRYSNDEIGDLADSFSRMVTAVRFFRAESEDAAVAAALGAKP